MMGAEVRWKPAVKFCVLAALLVGALLPALLAHPSRRTALAAIGAWLAWLGIGTLVACLLLIVREPAWSDAVGGLERMYRWHHRLGVAGYIALLAHPLLSLGPVRWLDAPAAWGRFVAFSRTPPGVLGWLALLGLALGLASTLAIHLRYGVWRRLHALLGVAVVLGIAHLLLLDVSRWSWALAAPVAIALAWRALRMDRGFGARPYEVSGVGHVAPELTEVSLKPLAQPLSMKAGQFVMAAFFGGPHYRGCGEYHPYTVIDARPDGTLVLSIKALGDCTRNVQMIEPGVSARIQGPYGRFLGERSATPELWVAGGIGVTPFISQLRAGHVTQPTLLIYAHRESKDVPYLGELRRHALEQSSLRVVDLQLGNDPSPLFLTLEGVRNLRALEIYLCGPPPLVNAVRDWLEQHGVVARQIHFERFDFR